MHYLAKKMAHFFIRKNIVAEENREVYEYCFEIMLSTICNFSLLLIGAIITGRYYETALFALVFVVLRKFAGGYHAKTNLGCMLTLVLTYIGMILLITFLDLSILNLIAIISSVFYVLVLFVFAPVEHHNNPMEENTKKKMRIIVIAIIVPIAAISIIFSTLLPTLNIAFSISYAAICVALSTLVGVIFNAKSSYIITT